MNECKFCTKPTLNHDSICESCFHLLNVVANANQIALENVIRYLHLQKFMAGKKVKRKK